MEDIRVFEEFGIPFTGKKRTKVKEFLAKQGLKYDEQIEYTVNLIDEHDEVIATGSVEKNILKCIAISSEYQGMGLAGRVLTLLENYAVSQGYTKLFLYTKPENLTIFSELGFFEIIKTDNVLFMENKRDGIRKYICDLDIKNETGTCIGAVVANCNPFTYGHRYLIETASAMCDMLYVFVLSEEKSTFSYKDRYEMVKRGTDDLANVYVFPSSEYMISTAVFPTYFLKDSIDSAEVYCEMDIRIFGECFAKLLGIKKRFIGSEPFCPVTNKYNEQLKQFLPEYGVEVVEIPRKTINDCPVSATDVRRLIKEGRQEDVKEYVPQEVYEYLRGIL